MAEGTEKKKNKLFRNIRHKYRLIIYNDNTFEEAFSFRLSRLNVIAGVGSVAFLLFFLGIFTIAFTPLREFIPRLPDGELQKNIIANAMRADSLEYKLELRDRYYLEYVRSIIEGRAPELKIDIKDTTKNPENINFSKSEYDSLLRKQIEHEEEYNLSVTENIPVKRGIAHLYFFPPLNNAVITNRFDVMSGHYGVDMVAAKNSGIKSVLDGTVLLAEWTLTTGYVIQIQHEDNLVSVYKHNSQLLKQAGDKVKAGETIAIIGNSGELSSGPHLHFELWHNGSPINPEDFIIF